MKTRVTRSARIAASFIRAGGLAAFPTETVYGLGANALDAEAVRKIFVAKGRPTDNPLIVHVAALADIATVARRLPRSAEKLLRRFAPGPLTVIVPKRRDLPGEVTAGLDTVGVRIPGHPVALAFLRACGTPVAAPSANRSGRPSPTTWRAALDELDRRIDAVLQGGASRVGLESTVVDCTLARPVILREGAVTLEELRKVVPSITSAAAKKRRGGVVKSPGMKYRHYAPTAEVVLVDGPEDVVAKDAAESAYIGLTTRGFPSRPALVQTCRGVRPYARQLFHFFRACERRGIRRVYCQRVDEVDLGRALMDRLRKAAADHPIGS